MNKYKIDSVILGASEYIIAFLIIYNANSEWYSEVDLLNLRKFGIAMAIITLLIDIIILAIQKKKISKKISATALGLVLYFIFYLLFSQYTQQSPMIISEMMLVVLFTIFLGLSSYEKVPGVFKKYKNIMVLIALITMFFWVFGTQLHLLAPNKDVLSTWGADTGNYRSIPSYYGLYYEPQLVRNSAIFTEGTMASLNFSVALCFLEIEKNTKLYKTQKNILVIAILSTISLTGYIFLGAYYLYSSIGKHKKNDIIKYLVIVITLVGLAIYVNHAIESKAQNTLSVSVRKDDYVVCYKAWKEHILFGSGLGNSTEIRKYMQGWRLDNRGLSNTIMVILAEGGLYVATMYLLPCIKGIISSKRKHDSMKILFGIYFVCLLFTTYFPFTYLVLFVLVWMGLGDYLMTDHSRNLTSYGQTSSI